ALPHRLTVMANQAGLFIFGCCFSQHKVNQRAYAVLYNRGTQIRRRVARACAELSEFWVRPRSPSSLLMRSSALNIAATIQRAWRRLRAANLHGAARRAN